MSDDSTPASEQFDLTAGMSFGVTPPSIDNWASELEDAEAFDESEVSDGTLAHYVEALKRLENVAEEARKEVFEPDLDDRVEVDASVGNLTRRSGSRRYLSDEDGAVAAIEEAGGDPTQAMSLDRTDFEDLARALGIDPSEFVGENEYTYYRRDS